MKVKTLKIPIQQQPSGDTLNILVFKFLGKPGPKVYIQANIHGPEVAGTPMLLELKKLLEKEKEIRGEITLVVSANPTGINSRVSGFPVGSINHNGDSSKNWNRIFLNLVSDEEIKEFVRKNEKVKSEKLLRLYVKFLEEKISKLESYKYGLSIENKLALTLQKLSRAADFVIDIHSAGINQLHVYTFAKNIKSAKSFGIKHLLRLPDEFFGAFDESFYLPFVKLSKEYKEIFGEELIFDKEAFTVELENDNEISSIKTKRYLLMLVNYLKSKGVVLDEAKQLETKFLICESEDYVKYFSPIGGLCEPLVEVGQKVKKGTGLVRIVELNEVYENVVLHALEDCVVNSFPVSKVVAEGEPVIGVLKNLKELKDE